MAYSNDTKNGATSFNNDSKNAATGFSNDTKNTLSNLTTGSPIGLLLALTYNITSGSYTFDTKN